MKFSEMETNRACDVICEILPNVQSIAADEELQNHFAEMAKVKKSDMDTLAKKVIFCMDTISALTLSLLKRHRSDIFSIVAALNDMTAEEVKKQPVMKTVKQFKECVSDFDFVQLFN